MGLPFSAQIRGSRRLGFRISGSSTSTASGHEPHVPLAEACNRLALPFEQREPIANIAFDVGYSALSSFNKAFKDLHNLTPTQYRDAANVGAGLAPDLP